MAAIFAALATSPAAKAAKEIVPPRDRTGNRVAHRLRDYDAELARARDRYIAMPTRKNRRRIAIAERRASVR